ncbi:DEAD/DEAH box helicase family protein [Allosalinactinospora lopnorensis]|uniref:DEAD/DEAH box helicase family protein n=1 Tax=Allosalinactinospora lopnorensis TaxID=1352348 RepID=UPI000623E126|nr:DEAD/DEAH box helicase family protein [Allosalinactinospora lopnorensis]
MSDLKVDEHLLEEVKHRLSLRDPNFRAVESVANMMSQHYDVEEKTEPFECIVDSATGVGKTYIMAGLLEYLAGIGTPARNFLILTPGRTIRDKTVRNFTPGDDKAITKSMRSDPVIVTADNFDSAATANAITDTSKTKVYIFTVQSLTETTEASGGRKTHAYQEFLGASFYDWLSTLDDLVILADEHHCYRGPAFSKTITNLNPELVVGVTATPDPKDEARVVYRYPLAKAIEDEYVKTPVLVARQDDRSDDRTKLLDGVTLLKHKERVSEAWAAENAVKPVRPVMLVIAQSIDDAEAYRDILDSESFDGGAWVGKTLLVHSKLTGEKKEKALADLDAVENPASPVRIIISIGMLKEGWDVKNVYVIASMRASVSEVLTEQTLGRGMRLPYGRYTGEQMLDTVEVLAHEKYEALLKKRQALSQSMVDHRILAQVRTTGDGKKVVRKKTEEVDNPFEGQAVPAPQVDDKGLPSSKEPVEHVQSLDDHLKQIEARAKDVPDEARTHMPLLDREPIRIPYVQRVPQPQAVSLNQVHEMRPFQALGEALRHDAGDTLIRTALKAKDGQIKGQKAEDTVEALHLNTPLETSRKGLIDRVMKVKGVERRKSERNAAESIVDTVIEAMGDTAAENLSAYFDRAARRLESEVAKQIGERAKVGVVFHDRVQITDLDKPRTARRKHEADHTVTFERSRAYNGWEKGAYEYAWFDSSPEYKVAGAVDADDHVIVWARLHRNDIPITWTQEGREYNPDLVVIEEANGVRTNWLVETKMNKEINAADVIAKKKAAKTWTNTINNSGRADGRWQYLLLSEDDVNDAAGSWAQMKDFGR